MGGFALLYRSLLDKGWASNPEYMATWIRLILKASHAAHEVFISGETINLTRGQFFTGRKALAKEIGISESSCERVLGFFKREGMISWISTNRGRVITIANYDRFQGQFSGDTPTHTQGDTPPFSEQQNEQQNEQPQPLPRKARGSSCEQQNEQQNEQPANSSRTASEHKQITEQQKEQNKREYSSCSEPSASEPENAVFLLPTNRSGESYGVTEAEVQANQALYPAVDVPQQYRSMIGWLFANQNKRKTLKGMPRFIQAWLSREQDKGGQPQANQQPRQYLTQQDMISQRNREVAKRFLEQDQ